MLTSSPALLGCSQVRDESVDPASLEEGGSIGWRRDYRHGQREGYRVEGPTPAELPVGLDVSVAPLWSALGCPQV